MFATTCGRRRRADRDRTEPNHGERVEEKEAVINRTNHASAGGRGGARWKEGSGEWKKGVAMAMAMRGSDSDMGVGRRRGLYSIRFD
jgi:hypothetical protein